MNKELREDLEHLIICNDKTITQDLRDDIKMTLDYIDKLEEENKNDYFVHMEEWARAIENNAKLRQIIDKAIEYIEKHFQSDEGVVCKIIGEYTCERNEKFLEDLLDILRGEDK